MEQRKSTTERAAHYTFGARFFKDGDDLMYEFVIDSGNVIGPRPATDADKEKYPREWAEFNGDPLPAEPASAIPPVVEFGKKKHREKTARR